MQINCQMFAIKTDDATFLPPITKNATFVPPTLKSDICATTTLVPLDISPTAAFLPSNYIKGNVSGSKKNGNNRLKRAIFWEGIF